MSDLIAGLNAEREYTVTDADSASRWGSGMVNVFSTPALVGLMESTAVEAIRGQLPDGQTTVGGRIDIHHLAATPIGMKVHAKAELIRVDGRKLVFKIQAWDEVELIGEADHDRIMIDVTKFIAKVEAKKKQK
jgi:fluoroacetyl-CoA thioesterase